MAVIVVVVVVVVIIAVSIVDCSSVYEGFIAVGDSDRHFARVLNMTTCMRLNRKEHSLTNESFPCIIYLV